MTNEVKTIGSANKDGYSYAGQLESFLLRPALHQAVLATAFLSLAAAELLTFWISRRRFTAKCEHLEVAFIVGSMQSFTERAAVQHLLRQSRALSSVATLTVHRPDAEMFHVKAAYLCMRRAHFAIVGSHNLTRFGLSSEGELGVQLRGTAARAIRDSLLYWQDNATPWSKTIRSYRQSRRPPTEGPNENRGRRTTPDVGVVAESVQAEDCEHLTPSERKMVDRVARRHLGTIASAHETLLLKDTTLEHAIDVYNFVTGACFDAAINDGVDWSTGQRRGIFRVSYLLPIESGRHCVLVYERRPIKQYTVTAPIRRRAQQLGIIDDSARTEHLRKFLDFLNGQGRSR